MNDNHQGLLSVVVPVFNEEKKLVSSLKKIENYFQKKRYLKEIIFVNDGSTDKTTTILEKFKTSLPIKVIFYKQNKGKGFAVKKGVLKM